MASILFTRKGKGSLSLIGGLLVIIGAAYAGVQITMPYFANADLEKKMAYWANYDFRQGNMDYPNFLKNIKETINTHDIPLRMNDIKIDYNPDLEQLTISAQYDVYVQFPGYEHHIAFSPLVEIQK